MNSEAIRYDFSVPGTEVNNAGGQFVYFEQRPKEMRFLSEKEGRPIFEDRDYIVITQAGGKTEFVAEVTDKHKRDYPREWAAYQSGLKEAVVGTPVEQWPVLSKAQIAMLKALSIRSVEQLAGCDDNAIERVGMGGRDLRSKAQAWLKAAKDAAFVTALQAENDRLKSDVEDLRRQMKEIAAKVDKKKTAASGD